MSRSSILALLAWFGAGLLAIGAWLALPRAASATGPLTRIVLLDVSASALGRDTLALAANVEPRVRELAAAARMRGEDVIGIAFGHGARRFDVESPLAGQFRRPESASDLDAALELASNLASDRDVAGIALVGDGTWTGTDPAASAARLAARGIEITRVDAHARRGDDVGLLPLASPIRVRRGAPIALEIQAWYARGDPAWRAGAQRVLVATATIASGGQRDRRVVRVALDDAALDNAARAAAGGPIRIDFDLGSLPSARATVEVRVELEIDGQRSDDALAENDVATTEILDADVLRVGVVGTSAARRTVIDALGPLLGDFALETVDDLAALAESDLDVLVTADVGFDQVDAHFLDAWVQRGRGWIEFAGGGFHGGARPNSAALVPASDDARPREIRVLIDASGSMAGVPARNARSALSLLVERAPVADGLQATWFSDTSIARVDLGQPGERADPSQRRAFADAAANGPEPHGPTRIWDALEELAQSLDPSRRTLAILVSDGRDPDRAEFAQRAQALRARLAAGAAELVVIVVGTDPDRELLTALAGDGARVISGGLLDDAEAAERLVKSFVRAIASGPIVTLDPPRRANFVGDRDGLAAPFAEFVPPALRRCLRARVRTGASALWRLEVPDSATAVSTPIFALARHGLGLSATFAFLPDGAWMREPSALRAALATTVHAVAPPPAVRDVVLHVRDGELVLEGDLRAAPAIVRAELFDARDEPIGSVDLYAARAGRDPERERSARLPPLWSDLGPGQVVRARIADAVAAGPIVCTLVGQRAPEFARSPAHFTPPPAGQERSRASDVAAHPAAYWVLLLGLLSLAGAVGGGFFFREGRLAR